jgi:hypothetical protein
MSSANKSEQDAKRPPHKDQAAAKETVAGGTGPRPAPPAETKYVFKILPADPRRNASDFEDVADK